MQFGVFVDRTIDAGQETVGFEVGEMFLKIEPRPANPGPRWRMTVLTIAAVFAITSLLQLLVMPHLDAVPWPLRLLGSAVVVVLLLGNVLMPALTRLFAGWLHPTRY